MLQAETANLKPRTESRVDIVFFFQAEDGIRDLTVTGVQTCALPISSEELLREKKRVSLGSLITGAVALLETDAALCESLRQRYRYILVDEFQDTNIEIGRASCRERV